MGKRNEKVEGYVQGGGGERGRESGFFPMAFPLPPLPPPSGVTRLTFDMSSVV